MLFVLKNRLLAFVNKNILLHKNFSYDMILQKVFKKKKFNQFWGTSSTFGGKSKIRSLCLF